MLYRSFAVRRYFLTNGLIVIFSGEFRMKHRVASAVGAIALIYAGAASAVSVSNFSSFITSGTGTITQSGNQIIFDFSDNLIGTASFDVEQDFVIRLVQLEGFSSGERSAVSLFNGSGTRLNNNTLEPQFGDLVGTELGGAGNVTVTEGDFLSTSGFVLAGPGFDLNFQEGNSAPQSARAVFELEVVPLLAGFALILTGLVGFGLISRRRTLTA